MPNSLSKHLHAQNLIRRGFKIFPIKAGKKYPPLVKDFPRVSEQCEENLDKWWIGNDNNIGIHCKDLLVLDIDIKKGGYESLQKLELENEILPQTLEFRTPTGGRHIIFRTSAIIRNSVGRLGDGIDVRTAGGYIVAPGSDVDAGPYEVHADREIADAPLWLVQLSQPSSPTRIEDSISSDQTIASQRARQWLAETPPAIEGQGGDHHTYSVICKLRDFGVSLDNIPEVISEWNARCEPPWDPDELYKKAVNAYKYAQSSPGANSVEAMFDIVHNPSVFTNNEQETKVDAEMYGPDDVQLGKVLSSEYIIKGWLDKQTHAMLFGHWGAGKTFIALHISAHVTAGEPWFDNRVHQGGVLYFGYEGHTALQRRVYALRQEYPEWDFSKFKIRPMRWPLVRRNAGDSKLTGQAKLEYALKAYKEETGAYPSLIVIDPLRNALGGSDSDPDLTAPFLTYLQKLSKVTGCSTLTIHHPGHADAERGRGDSGLEAHMDTVIKVDGDRGRIETKKQRDDPSAALHYKLRVVEIGTDSDGDIRTTCVVEPVDPNALDPTLTDQQQAAVDKMRDLADPTTQLVTKSMFRRSVNGLAKGVQDEIFDALIRKQYLVPEGKQWRLGVGAAEMFS